MALFIESGYTSVNKHGEELCGDKVEIVREKGFTTLVLADGLGSGVKANILATLTSKILSTMVSSGAPIEDAVETVAQTLPVCKERGVAYATFTVVHINDLGQGYLFEFDNPAAILLRNGVAEDFNRKELVICKKKVYQTELSLKAGDFVIMFSDGVIGAGAGMFYNSLWQRADVAEYIKRGVTPDTSATATACLLASACYDLYVETPGDDTTVAAVKVRNELPVSVMVGPPVDKDNDALYVKRFLSGAGKKVVCGGTSAKIVAKYLNKEIDMKFDPIVADVPPISKIEGIDLTTEGALTLIKLKTLSDAYVSHGDLSAKHSKALDGASLLMDMLFEQASSVDFFVGQSVNAAHVGTGADTTVKLKLIEAVADNLKKCGKIVNIFYD